MTALATAAERRDFRRAVFFTAAWTFPPLCWCAVFVSATRAPFGMPDWLCATVHLSAWLVIVANVWRTQRAAT